MSEVLSDKRAATWDFCAKVARALGEPPQVLFRLAGLLTSPALDDATAQQILDTLQEMSPEERDEVLEYAKLRYRRTRRS